MRFKYHNALKIEPQYNIGDIINKDGIDYTIKHRYCTDAAWVYILDPEKKIKHIVLHIGDN